MAEIHDWFRALKDASKDGMLLYDGEPLLDARWKINSRVIEVTVWNCTYCLFQPGDDPAETLADLKPRFRLFRETQISDLET